MREIVPHSRSVSPASPWGTVCPGASPYWLDGPVSAVNGPDPSPVRVMAQGAARLDRSSHTTTRSASVTASKPHLAVLTQVFPVELQRNRLSRPHPKVSNGILAQDIPAARVAAWLQDPAQGRRDGGETEVTEAEDAQPCSEYRPWIGPNGPWAQVRPGVGRADERQPDAVDRRRPGDLDGHRRAGCAAGRRTGAGPSRRSASGWPPGPRPAPARRPRRPRRPSPGPH